MISTDRLCMGCMTDNGGEEICPICGFNSKENNPKNAVSIKTVIGDRFVVGRVLSANGEGITYIGWDTANDAIVRIREYFPVEVAKRNPDKTVSVVKGKEYVFNEGLLEFMEINKTIKSSDLPSLVPVIDVYEENGTAFAVMKNIPGITLGEFLSRNGGTLKWEQARALFLPLIDTIQGMHELGIIHKGISTDTIIVGRDGKLRITGYSINKLRTENEDIKVDILDGFAAVEQYNTQENFSIGAYTDVYGFCATLFNVLIGTLPARATERLENDSMTIPSKFAEELPRQVLSSLANALQVKPQDRTQDMESLKNQLVYGESPVAAAVVSEPVKKKKSGSGIVILITTIVTAILILILAIILMFTVFRDKIFGNGSKPDGPSNSMPTSSATDSVESTSSDPVNPVEVPDLEGQYYSSIIDKDYADNFIIKIVGKEFSDAERGTVIKQSVKAYTTVEKDTIIEIVISLGRQDFTMPSVLNMTREEAEIALLRAGFLYENIQILDIYDEDFAPYQVVDQSPSAGSSVNADIAVKIFINSYEGDESEEQGIY